MKHIYLEVDVCGNHAHIIDWTEIIAHHKANDNYRELYRINTGFVRIAGKDTSYHVKGLGENVKRCQAFAIWYHTAKTSGNISTYRLD